ncbi:lipopolysaccharide transport periplasmic protein LptA [Thioalkalivibrio nitratireducens]|uniref:lipopolysaccharide transport periplasmic protein LptA n=1 Tax=Thioalkalivibrio nitratireducens TaxID=186931 RepID=UPI0002F2CEFF|nr:lipopolysaccharide transport periplasmic protein LptA [Thioalkalivibrio nitratireducens]
MNETRPAPQSPVGAATALLGLALFAAPAILAAQTLEELPVHISADRAEMDDRRGVGTYSGSVEVTRGNLTLHADRIVIHAPERRPVRMEAEGNPVRAESPDPAGQPRVATADRMEYTFDDQILVLLQDARVQTATEDASGERITYDLAQDIIGIEGSETRRVHITILPRPE